MLAPDTPRQNHFLAALPPADYSRLLPHLERIELPYGRVLYEAGIRQEYIYFPTSSVVSLLCFGPDGSAKSTAVIGNEGLVGVALLLGGKAIPSRAVVQSGGYGYRLRAGVLQGEFGRRSELQHLLLRFTQALITQMAQTAVCHQHHSTEQQLCRWLLLSLDSLPADDAAMAQELAVDTPSGQLGAISEAARNLQRTDSLHYRRGRVTVLDRMKLERRVCECYAIVKEESERLLWPHRSALEALA